MTVIDKLAWLQIVDRRLLCVRSRGQDAFYLPGGKREPGESDFDCLRREIAEELAVALVPATLVPAGVFQAQAHGKGAGTVVRLTCYEGAYTGELRASAEIEAFAWLGVADRAQCSVAVRAVLDAMAQQGRLD